LNERFKIREVRYDPYQMQATEQSLQRHGVPMVEFPQTVGNLTDASSNLYELVKAQGILAYRDADIRLAMQRAVAVEGTRGWRIAKDKQSHKIDIVVALGMAALVCVRESSTRRGEVGARHFMYGVPYVNLDDEHPLRRRGSKKPPTNARFIMY
jgi:phage terminase large subunit-like protein